MSEVYRPKQVVTFSFASGATTSTVVDATGEVKAFASLQGVSGAAFVFDSDFDTDTITVKSSVTGDTGFTITAATGRVNLDSDQALAFAPMPDFSLTTDAATSGAAEIRVMLFG